MIDLREARKIAEVPTILSAPEYLRAILQVQIAILDRTEPVAPTVADKKPTKGKAD